MVNSTPVLEGQDPVVIVFTEKIVLYNEGCWDEFLNLHRNSLVCQLSSFTITMGCFSAVKSTAGTVEKKSLKFQILYF